MNYIKLIIYLIMSFAFWWYVIATYFKKPNKRDCIAVAISVFAGVVVFFIIAAICWIALIFTA